MASVGTDRIETGEPATFDVVIIGAGVSGLYQLHRLRSLGFSVLVIEAGAGVGGTWYWNRYPGARFDSESYTYAYSFSPELLDGWNWSEHFAAQPETLAYLNYVADTLELRPDIRFNCRVTASSFNNGQWETAIDDGTSVRSQFLITAIGALTVPTMPTIDGIDDFEGFSCHTARWPEEPVDLNGKRVAVIGTGATGVQVIQEAAKVAGHLSVFQRNPNWCAPLHNRPIEPEEQPALKARYGEMFAQCADTFAGFVHDVDRRKALEVSEHDRLETFERLYSSPGFGIWMANFRDILVDAEANETLSRFVADKIRQRVDDPRVADKLIPTNHGFGTRRVPMETNYYEVYNQANVELVDLRDTPIEQITATGIRTSDQERQFDVVIYATGFDPVTGAFDKIDVYGPDGRSLRDKWAEGPKTYLGLTSEGFPNLFTLVGPHNAATFCNMPRCIEQNVDWVTDLIVHMRDADIDTVEATAAAEAEWTEHVYATADRMLLSKVDSWFMGVNTNVAGKQQPNFLLYAGGLPLFRQTCDDVAADNYRGFDLR